MFSLALRSLFVLTLLFGIAFAVSVGVMYYLGASWTFAAAMALGMVALQYLISPWIIEWVHQVDWCTPQSVDPELAIFIQAICRQKALHPPRFGIIHDGNPNAFTFGHYPGNARMVVTTGLLQICDEQEVQTVVAHELGHIVHWDFVVMTLAAAVPMVLYVIYRLGLQAGRGRNRNAAGAMLVAAVVFVAYFVSQYLVLFLSRVREYYADHFAADITRNPNGLASALVKIAYGLARAPQEQEDEERGRRPALSTAGGIGSRSLGIFDLKFGASLALAAAGSYSAEGGYSHDATIRAMRWDLWNPWAFLCELSSTHPLPAKRIKHLEDIAWELGHKPLYDLPEPSERPENYWDEFVIDVLVAYMPLFGLLGGIAVGVALGLTVGWSVAMVGLALLGLGAGMLIRTQFVYPKRGFPAKQVAELLPEIKVSRIRCLPCSLSGNIIGRGIPGLYWSEDLVIRDKTGFIRLDYRQPLRFLELLFGLFRAEEFIGREVVIKGWYRRWPAPYIELWKLREPSGPEQTCWNWALAFYGSLLLTALGLLIAIIGLLVQI
ncbi:MAG: zinc metalloprotease HtpX [Candidatus Zipacnadales bacterium]